MKSIYLGNTNIQISRQGLGCMGMSEFYGATNDENSISVIHKAIEKGVNFFDTADMYGYGENEILLGRAITDVEFRESLVISTKCGIYRDRINPKMRTWNNTPEYIEKCCSESLDRLNTYIDLYYIHRVVEDKQSIRLAMKKMAELIDKQKIRSLGLSEISAEYLVMAHDYLLEFTKGEHGISALQTEYSLMTRDVEKNDVFKTCSNLGITFVAYSPICRGLLSGLIRNKNQFEDNDFRKNLPRFSNDNLPTNLQLVEEMEKLANKKQCTLAQLSLAWVHETGAVPIPGTKQLKYLSENISAESIKLTKKEFNLLSDLSSKYQAKGDRY
ncbi:aldo/keto reductase [Microbulbifer sp. 2205BS26-8]|uniref:aldo/keto reductase n=1 Tax=Microbulbifer sp. 2205BS26-8 TaxID=3064386 RepID=UPI00274008AE|nr:aldo/keto reductase [Microbulbifer sp. 2205BS26-8]MDP5211012.1 aldo/keto reductase [Microbulbifer sp. 2205BS26-8]